MTGPKLDPTPGGVARAIRELQREPKGWVGIIDLRKRLGGTRAEQDATLKQLSRMGKIHIVPDDNRKVLTQEDHDAAIRIGGEPNHVVALA